MRRTISLLLAVIGTVALMAGCQSTPAEEERPWPETVVCSNLSDEASRELARQLLSITSGEEQIQVFFDHVDQINRFLEPQELTDGFEEVSITQPKYDSYDIQARWEAEHPDFLGYNCRITAFSQIRGQLTSQESMTAGSPDYIMMDLLSLQEDPSAIPDPAGMEAFQALYAGVETENTKDIAVHLEHLQKDWAERHIAFDQGSASLISVVFHDQLDGDRLFIGHTGILYEQEEELYFLEKLAFQEPYQLVKIASRAELSDYLMAKYDVEFNQSMAAPFVLENDALIEGYRSHSQV